MVTLRSVYQHHTYRELLQFSLFPQIKTESISLMCYFLPFDCTKSTKKHNND